MSSWMPIAGYEGLYEVSDNGRVKSLRSGRLLTVRIGTRGYPYVDLAAAGIKHRFSVHRLVAVAYHGPSQFPCSIVNHLNGIKSDNAATNLEWTDHRGNALHAFATGIRGPTDVRGERNPRAKLTREQVAEIRSLRGSLRQIDIAARYGVSKAAVYYILKGKHWT